MPGLAGFVASGASLFFVVRACAPTFIITGFARGLLWVLRFFWAGFLRFASGLARGGGFAWPVGGRGGGGGVACGFRPQLSPSRRFRLGPFSPLFLRRFFFAKICTFFSWPVSVCDLVCFRYSFCSGISVGSRRFSGIVFLPLFVSGSLSFRGVCASGLFSLVGRVALCAPSCSLAPPPLFLFCFLLRGVRFFLFLRLVLCARGVGFLVGGGVVALWCGGVGVGWRRVVSPRQGAARRGAPVFGAGRLGKRLWADFIGKPGDSRHKNAVERQEGVFRPSGGVLTSKYSGTKAHPSS